MLKLLGYTGWKIIIPIIIAALVLGINRIFWEWFSREYIDKWLGVKSEKEKT